MESGEKMTNGYTVTVSFPVIFKDDDNVYEFVKNYYAPTLNDAASLAILLSGMGQTVEKITAVFSPDDLSE